MCGCRQPGYNNSLNTASESDISEKKLSVTKKIWNRRWIISTQYANKFADILTQSYHPVKNITTGEGGALLSKKKSIDSKIKLLRNFRR